MEGNAASERPPLNEQGGETAAPPGANNNAVGCALDSSNSNAVGTLSWEQWDAASGVVSLGGDAVEDCDRLYDGR